MSQPSVHTQSATLEPQRLDRGQRTDFALVTSHNRGDVVLDDLRERRLVRNAVDPAGNLLGPHCAMSAGLLPVRRWGPGYVRKVWPRSIRLFCVAKLTSASEPEKLKLPRLGCKIKAGQCTCDWKRRGRTSVASHFMLFSGVTWPKSVTVMLAPCALLCDAGQGMIERSE